MVVALPRHRRKGEWPPCEPPQAPLSQVCTAIGQYRLLQGHRLHRLIGPIHAPPQPAYRRLQRGFVHPDLDGGMMIMENKSWRPTGGPHWTRCGVWGQAKPDEVFPAIALHNGHHGLTEGRHRLKALFPAPALVESQSAPAPWPPERAAPPRPLAHA